MAEAVKDKEAVGDWIKKIPFFKEFTPEEINHIARLKNSIMTIPSGVPIISQGDADLSFYILLRGKVFITKKEYPSRKIATLPSGCIFGEVSFIQPRPRPANVISEGEVVVLRMDGEMLEKLAPETLDKIKDRILETLLWRLDDINRAMVSYAR